MNYLFGPVSKDFADRYLPGLRRSGNCLAFDAAGETDLAIGPTDTWEAVLERLPAAWHPNFLVLYLPYTTVPASLWTAPVPIIGLAADWNLLYHVYRLQPPCDLLLTDTLGVEVLTRAGIDHVRRANLYGCSQALLESFSGEQARDIDILFVGNMSPSVQAERLSWIARLARLAARWRVLICQGVFGEEYRRLLARARIGFNRSVRGEINQRALEVAAAGALLFQEADNREIEDYFTDRREYVAYTEGNLEERLEHYLEQEDERRTLAEAAHQRVRGYTFEALWAERLAEIADQWPVLQERARLRLEQATGPSLSARLWGALCANPAGEPFLARDLGAALVAQPHASDLHNALGLLTARQDKASGHALSARAREAVGYFQRAQHCDPGHAVAGLNAARALVSAGQYQPAIDQAQHTLAILEHSTSRVPSWLQAPLSSPPFDTLHVEWEKAAWSNAGRPEDEARAKQQLLRWALHALLAEMTGEPAHWYEATVARPDLPATRAALGNALARAGRPQEAVPHLSRALTASPFDFQTVRALFKAHGEAGDAQAQRQLADDYRLLSLAAPQVVPSEPWIEKVPPPPDGLASLILLCCNELEYTRQCLESILRHTHRRYELILVDNGSTDGTATFLDAFRSRPGPERVVVLHNSQNRGFAAGCNQGLSRARGRYVVFLNNDTVVTAGWLKGLIAWSLHNWPAVGLVGPVSNGAPPPQFVQTGYSDVSALDAFAAEHRRAHAGQGLVAVRITGFCLLIRREVLRVLGSFDERYGLGFFEDDDLCLRAREAGFQLLVARDVYIHHYGGRTFAALGIDTQAQLQANLTRFKAKWGEERTAAYRVPGPRVSPPPQHGPSERPPSVEIPQSSLSNREEREEDPRSPAPSPPACQVQGERFAANPESAEGERALGASVALPARMRVSLCMIVRNEEQNLPACLASAADLADEVNVVDTGSTDRTREVAAHYGARVFDFPWVDSFAAARNESLRHATGDFCFWLDADDRLDAENRGKLRELFGSLRDENVAFSMKCLCLPDPARGASTAVDHVRLFRNHPDLRWVYRIHEQILPAIRKTGGLLRWSDITIQHAGYQDPALRERKLQRDLRLLQLENADRPDDPFTLFNLGSVYLEMGRAVEALPLLKRSLARSHPADSIVRKLYALIVHCHRHFHETEEALDVSAAGRQLYPDDLELLFQEGLARADARDLDGAAACFLHALESREGNHFTSVDTGLSGYKARHNLGIIYRDQGRAAEAEAQWLVSVREEPSYAPAWVGLAELYLSQGRLTEADNVQHRLAAESSFQVEATVLSARIHLAQKDFATAKHLLQDTTTKAPSALWPRVILSHALLQEGADPDAAERALREVLALDPQHAEARHNLSLLLAQRSGSADPRHR